MASPIKEFSFADDEEGPEFFKVFIPKFSSEKMGIPTDFVTKFIQKVPDFATVKDGSGKCWKIALVTIEKDLYFGTGWEEFARDNSLKRGDFLVFKYNTPSLFEVKIFGPSGCLKGVTSPQIHGHAKIEEEQTNTKPSQALKQTQTEERSLNGSTRKSGKCEEISQGNYQ